MTNRWNGYYGTWGATTQAGPLPETIGKTLYNPNRRLRAVLLDSTNVLSAYAVYELPIGRGRQVGNNLSPAVNAVIGNWLDQIRLFPGTGGIPAFTLWRVEFGNREPGKSPRLPRSGLLPEDS